MDRKPTVRQRRLAKGLAENQMSHAPLSVGAVMREIGYSSTISEQPSRITESSGFKKALAELGLTEELVVTALVNDILDKPSQRVKELTLAADILGMRRKEADPTSTTKSGNNVYNFFFNPEVQSKVKIYEDEIKKALMQKHY